MGTHGRPEFDSPDTVRSSRWIGAHGSGPTLPHEPARALSLEDADYWSAIYDVYVEKLIELGREYDIDDELQVWIDRCTRRKAYWARARRRLRRQGGSQ